MRLRSYLWCGGQISGFVGLLVFCLCTSLTWGPVSAQPLGVDREASTEEQRQQLKELQKSLKKLREVSTVQQLAGAADEARDRAADSGEVAGYVFHSESAGELIPGSEVRDCLQPNGHFLGSYVVAVVESDAGQTGGLGTTPDIDDVDYDVDILASEFMPENAPLLGQKPGAWIAIDIDDGEVAFSTSKRWPKDKTNPESVDQYLARHSFAGNDLANSAFSDDKPGAVCELVAAFETALGDGVDGLSPMALTRRHRQSLSRAKKLRKKLISAKKERSEATDTNQASEGTSDTSLSSHLKKINTRKKQVRNLPSPVGDDIVRPDQTLKKIDDAVSKLKTTLDAAESDLQVYQDHRDWSDAVRRRLRSMRAEQWPLTVSWIPFTGKFRSNLEEAARRTEQYEALVDSTLDATRLAEARSRATDALHQAHDIAEDSKIYVHATVFYLPGAIIVFLFLFGIHRARSATREATRARSDLEFEVTERRESLDAAKRRLESLADRVSRMSSNHRELRPVELPDVDSDPVDPPEALDVGFSLASLERHLLTDAESALQQAGGWDPEPLQDALDELQTASTTVAPGSEWEQKRLTSGLTVTLDVRHRRLPDQLTELTRRITQAVQSAQSERQSHENGADEETELGSATDDDSGADIHW